MADEKPPVKDPKPDAKPDAKALADQRTKLLSELAALEAQAQDAGFPAVPTHRLLLADGSTVEHPGTVSTHHTNADGQSVPVVGAIEL